MLTLIAYVSAMLSPMIEAGITPASMAHTESICGIERTFRIVRFVNRQPLEIRNLLWRRYSEREIQNVTDALAERERRIAMAVETAKRNVVLSYNVCPTVAADGKAYFESKAFLQTGRYNTSDGPRAVLEGPFTRSTARQMAETKARRNASAMRNPRY